MSLKRAIRACSSPLASQALPGVEAKSRRLVTRSPISSVNSSNRLRSGSVGCLAISLDYARMTIPVQLILRWSEPSL